MQVEAVDVASCVGVDVGSEVAVTMGVITVMGVGGTGVIAWVGKLVGNGLGGIVLVGSAAAVWAAWVKTSPGFCVCPPVIGRLQADKMIARTSIIANLGSEITFMFYSL